MTMIVNEVASPMSVRSLLSNHKHSRSSIAWKRLQPCSVARQDAGSTVVLSSASSSTSKPSTIGILVVGGRSDEGTSLNVAELFEWSSKRWWKLPPLEQARCGCAVASLDKAMYVFGGVGQQEDGSAAPPSVSSSIEYFFLGDKAWMTEPTPMPNARWCASAVSFPFHSDIVLLGGRDPSSWKELCSADAYDTETKEWRPLSNMNRPRFGCGATRITPSTLLVAGGYDGNEWTTSCEVYDYSNDEWTSVPDMPLAMQFCTATTLDTDFVVVSGQALLEDDVSSEVSEGSPLLVYQISQEEWTVLDSSTTTPAAADAVTGSVMLAVNGTYVVAVGGTDPEGVAVKSTRISSNLMAVLTAASAAKEDGLSYVAVPPNKITNDDDAADDVTIATFKSTSSVSRNTSMSHLSSDDDGLVPWWASPQKFKNMTNDDVISPMMAKYHRTSSKRLNVPMGDVALVEKFSPRGRRTRAGDDHSGFGDHSNHCAESVASSVGTSRSAMSGSRSPVPGKNRKERRTAVEAMETTDADGVPVLYTGSIQEGRPHGKGKMVWESGDTYVGSVRHGWRHGRGCHSFRDGRQYEGRFVSNEMEDANGQMTWKDGTIYLGSFMGGKRTGQGIQRFPTNVRYEGSFLDGKYSGYGVCVFADGSMYDGEWVQGKAHGRGKVIATDGKVLHNGMWQNDSPVIVQATS